MFRPSVLAFAVLLSSPALFSAFVTGSMTVTTALIRFLIALPVAAVMVLGFQSMTSSYQRAAKKARLERALAERANVKP